jgi:hypothetical protein
MVHFDIIEKKAALKKSSQYRQYHPQGLADFETILNEFCDQIAIPHIQKILRSIGRSFGVKFQLGAKAHLVKYSDEIQDYIRLSFWFLSDQHNVSALGQISTELNSSTQEIIGKYDGFVHAGSGWNFTKVEELFIHCNTYKIIRGGCWDNHLPKTLRLAKKTLLLLDNNQNEKCFIYAIVSALANVKRNANRCTHRTYKQILKQFKSAEFKFPFKLSDVVRFEKRHPFLSINIYGLNEHHLFPYHITMERGRECHVNLLLHNNHYYAIKNLSALLCQKNKANKRKTIVCPFCLSYFYKQDKFELHTQLCAGKGPRYEMPSMEKSQMAFSSFSNLIEAPFVIYCDLESLIGEERRIDEGKIFSARLHKPIAAGALTVCRTKPQFSSSPFIYTGEDCINKLFEFILSEYERICQVLNTVDVPMVLTNEQEESFFNATHCESCHEEFSDEKNNKVRDHDHLSGKYRNALCNRCNLSYAKQKYSVFIFFHGLSNYDLHFLIQEMHKYVMTSKINIIPRTSEKYLAISFNNLHFKDSYQFLMASLSELALNLKTKGTEYFKNAYRFITNPKQREVFFQKGIYPYSYMDSIEKLCETQLPPQAMFTNDLTNEPLSDGDYASAQNVWEMFSCKTMKDYMEVYLLADILLLADIFENFRDNCLNDYELDPAYYFSSPHFTFEAYLRKMGQTLDLLTDVNQYLFLSRGIRGGLCQVSKRYAKANNPYTPNFNPNKEESYILYLDANNLYGKAMMDYLPFKNFEWMAQDELTPSFVLSLPAEGNIGCIVECDLYYPKELHDSHSDFPLAPHKVKIPYNDLSPFARSLCDKHDLKRSTKTEKLMTTFRAKKQYVLHYRNLQLYIKLGMKLGKMHRGIKFQQGPIMKGYIDFNSDKRALSTNSFDSNFYKLLSNSLFGKTIERPEKRSRVILTTSKEKHEQLVGSLCYKQSKIINSDLVGVTLGHEITKVVKPCYLGISILELAKYHMYQFYYNVLKKYFNEQISLLYTDTDSLICHITCSKLYEDHIPKIKDYFDFSNYPKHHPLYSVKNKKIPGFFKDEVGGRHITEFIGLRSKMYSFMLDGKENKVAKGVKKSVIEKQLSFNDYKSCLFKSEQKEHAFKNIVSKNHHVFTLSQSKTTLSSFDDKRFLLSRFASLPYGHYLIDDEHESV